MADLETELANELPNLDVFADLAPLAKKTLVRFARIKPFKLNQEFIRQGEYTGDFYVVLSGLVSAYRTDSSGRTEILEQLRPGQWFGELSALSNQPSLAKLKADAAGVLVSVDAGLFKDLYSRGGKAFKKRIDTHYRERSLAQHLRVVPLLKDLSKGELDVVRALAEFKTYEKDVTIAEQGQPVDALYLIRSGAVTRNRATGNEPGKLDRYLMSNSSFGESAIDGKPKTWRGTYAAMMRSDVLVLPIATMRGAFVNAPATLRKLEDAARMIVAEEAGIDTGYYDLTTGSTKDSSVVSEQELEQMVTKQSAKGGDALVIDLQKCVRCNACVESCVAVHDDHVPRLSKKGNRIEAAGNALNKEISMVTSCYHCETPSCMMACNNGAIRRDAQSTAESACDRNGRSCGPRSGWQKTGRRNTAQRSSSR